MCEIENIQGLISKKLSKNRFRIWFYEGRTKWLMMGFWKIDILSKDTSPKSVIFHLVKRDIS